MARFMSELILRLTDAVSAPARQASQSIKGITKAIRDNNVKALTATSKSLGREVRGLTGELVGAAAGFGAYAAALSVPVRRSQEFESTLTDIGQKADMTRKEVGTLGRDLVGVGRSVNQTAQDLAGGVDTLAGLGLDPKILKNGPVLAKQLIEPIGRAATAYKAQISDLANASYAAVTNLKVPVDQTGKVLDVMALAGKKGAFELKDMAQYMPSLAASAEGLGQKGVPAVADLAAALQIARRGAGDSAEAATNVGNLLQKIAAPGTVRAFDKMGVDLVASMKALEKEGRTPLEAIAELTNKTLGGDMSRIGYLFEDAQVQKALRPLIRDLEDFKAIRAEALAANGTVERDFAERMKDGAAQAQRLKVEASGLALAIGSALLPPINDFLQVITPIVGKMADFAGQHPKLTSAILLTVGGLFAFRGATVAVKLASAVGKKSLVDLALGFSKMRGVAKAALSGVGRGIGSLVLGVDGLLTKMAGRPIVAFGRALLGLVLPMTAVEGGLFGIRLALIGTGVGAIIVGLGLAAVLIMKHWRGFVTYYQGIARGFMAALKPVLPALQPLIGALKNFGAWIGGFFKSNPGEDWSKWGEMVGGALAFPIVNLVNFITWVGEAIKKVKTFFGIKGKPPDVGAEGRRRLDAGWVGGPKSPPGRARGGGVEPGRDYWVGEQGPEIVRFPRRGRVYPNGSGPPAGSAGRSAPVFAPQLTFHVTGGDARAIADEVMARLQREHRRMADASFYDSDLRPA